MAQHAKLSPSSASRWMACTPSAMLERDFPDTRSSYADEGTLAHAISELMLLNPPHYDDELAELQKNEHYDDQMLEYCQGYADYVTSKMEPGDLLLVEQRVDMDNYVPEGFGTADAIIVKKDRFVFCDLKYGKGVRVYAVENKQLKLYALGILHDLGLIYDFKEAELNIYQPRIDNVSSWTVSVADLLKWAEEELKEKAEMAAIGAGEFCPGDHCGFCRALPVCKAVHDHNLQMARLDFADPATITMEQLADVLNRQDLFTTWIKAVNEYAMNQALAGNKVPGYKVVQGRSNRKIVDQPALIANFEKAGIPKEKIMRPEAVKTITELEKIAGKVKFPEIAGTAVVKPEGKPTLVPLSDEREEFSSAAADFKDGN